MVVAEAGHPAERCRVAGGGIAEGAEVGAGPAAAELVLEAFPGAVGVADGDEFRPARGAVGRVAGAAAGVAVVGGVGAAVGEGLDAGRQAIGIEGGDLGERSARGPYRGQAVAVAGYGDPAAEDQFLDAGGEAEGARVAHAELGDRLGQGRHPRTGGGGGVDQVDAQRAAAAAPGVVDAAQQAAAPAQGALTTQRGEAVGVELDAAVAQVPERERAAVDVAHPGQGALGQAAAAVEMADTGVEGEFEAGILIVGGGEVVQDVGAPVVRREREAQRREGAGRGVPGELEGDAVAARADHGDELALGGGGDQQLLDHGAAVQAEGEGLLFAGIGMQRLAVRVGGGNRALAEVGMHGQLVPEGHRERDQHLRVRPLGLQCQGAGVRAEAGEVGPDLDQVVAVAVGTIGRDDAPRRWRRGRGRRRQGRKAGRPAVVEYAVDREALVRDGFILAARVDRVGHGREAERDEGDLGRAAGARRQC